MHRQEEQQHRGICHGALLEDVARPPKDCQERLPPSTAPVLSGGKNTLSGVPLGSLWNQLLLEMLINELTKGIEAVLIKSACNMQEKEKG